MAHHPRPPPPQNKRHITHTTAQLTLNDLYSGSTRKIKLARQVLCPECSGTGGKNGIKPKPCQPCGGKGFQMQLRPFGPGMMTQVQVRCSSCGGAGETMRQQDRCTGCKGEKLVPDKKILEVHIDKGMEDEQRITFAGESNQEPGVPTGDVVIILDQREHETFKRQGNDLLMQMVGGVQSHVAAPPRRAPHLGCGGLAAVWGSICFATRQYLFCRTRPQC